MLTAAIVVGISSLPNTATACGACVFSTFEYALPHTLAWCLGIIIWFWIVMTISAFYRFFTPVLWIVAAFLIGGAFFGPLPFAFLGLMAFATTIKMFKPETWKQLSKQKQIGLKMVSAAAVLCVVVGLTVSMHTKKNRSDADFILQWGGDHQSYIILQKLIAQKDTIQLQRILTETEDEYFAHQAAEALATIAEEENAFSLNLIKTRGNSEKSWRR